MLDQATSEATSAPISPRRVGRIHAFARTRSFVPLHPSLFGTLLDRAVRWLLPWELREYPGLGLGSTEMLPDLSHYTVLAYRKGTRRLAPRVAGQVADMIEAECNRGLALVDELRKVQAEPNRVPAGFRAVKDWNGDGVVTDARGKRRRAKKV